jgi:hypothetical protein
LFTLEWLQSQALRRRVHVGLNKGEAKNADRRGPSSLTAWVNCEIEHSKTSAIEQAA